MFRGRGAKTYDFSKWRPHVVAAVVVIVCVFVSGNTHFDQFLRVSRLPSDRNETSVLKDLRVSLTGNRFDIVFALKCVFTITRDHFVNSMAVTLESGIFTVTWRRPDFGHFKTFENGTGKIELITPVYGESSLSVRVLNDSLFRESNYSPRVSWLLPNMSLATDQQMTYVFDNVAFSDNKFITFFHCDVSLRDRALKFESGRVFEHNGKRENSKDFREKNPQCQVYKDPTLVLAEPSANETAFKWAISVLNQVAQNQEKPTAVLLNEEQNELRELLQFFPKVTQVPSANCTFFQHAEVRARTSHDFGVTRHAFDGPRQDAVAFLVDNPDFDAHGLSKKLCGHCEAMVIDMSRGYAAAVPNITRCRYIVAQRQKYTALAFLLPRGSTIYTLNEEPEPWAKEMAFYTQTKIAKL